MLLRRFRHHRPDSLEDALALLARHGEDASPIAGGTELLVALKARVLQYDHLIDLKRLPELQGVRQAADGTIVIGALATHFALSRDPLIARVLPAYAALSDQVANIRVRVAGTLGGNLCFAEPHADPPALLAALDATLVLAGPRGRRTVAMADFIEAEFTTVRATDEILVEVRVPAPVDGARFAYDGFGQLERPAVGIAAGCLPDAAGSRWHVWAGAIAARPVRLETVEAALAGVPAAALGDVLPAAARDAAASLHAQDDLHGSADYKRHLAETFIGRVVRRAAGLPA